MVAVGDVNKLSHDAEAIARFADAALKNGCDVQAFPNGSQIDMFPFERECGRPRHDTKILDLSKGVDDLFSNAVCEELIFRIRTHVGEWEDDNGRMLSASGCSCERLCRLCLRFTGRFSRICVPLQSLQVGPDLRGVLVAQNAVLLKRLVND